MGFDASDLDANRRGEVTKRQRRALLTPGQLQRMTIARVFMFLFLAAGLAAVAWGLVDPERKRFESRLHWGGDGEWWSRGSDDGGCRVPATWLVASGPARAPGGVDVLHRCRGAASGPGGCPLAMPLAR